MKKQTISKSTLALLFFLANSILWATDLPQGKLPEIELTGAANLSDEKWSDRLCNSVLRTPQASNIVKIRGSNDYLIAGHSIFADKGPAQVKDSTYALYKLSWPQARIRFFASVTYPYDGIVISNGWFKLGFGIMTLWDPFAGCTAGVGRGVVVRIAGEKKMAEGIWEEAPQNLPDGAFGVIGSANNGQAVIDLVHHRIMQIDPKSASLKSVWTYPGKLRPLYWNGAEKSYVAISRQRNQGWRFGAYRSGRKNPSFQKDFNKDAMLIGSEGRYASISKAKENGEWVVGVDPNMTKVEAKNFFYIYGLDDWNPNDTLIWPHFDSLQLAVLYKDGSEIRIVDMNKKNSVRSFVVPKGLSQGDLRWTEDGKTLFALIRNSKSKMLAKIRYIDAVTGKFVDQVLGR